MRRIVPLLVVLLGLLPHASAAAGVVVAAGTATYRLSAGAASCEETAPFTVEVDLRTGNGAISGATTSCPFAPDAYLRECAGSDAGKVRCAYGNGAFSSRLTLDADGTLSYAYVYYGGKDTVDGQLDRR